MNTLQEQLLKWANANGIAIEESKPKRQKKVEVEKVEFELIKLNYDNTRAKRPLQVLVDGKVYSEGFISAWAVRKEDVEEFIHMYNDLAPRSVIVKDVSKVYAVDFRKADLYVCHPFLYDDRFSHPPKAFPFNPKKHCIKKGLKDVFCPCGCGEFEGTVTYFHNPFQMIILEN
ncbi:hypothetical protein [Parageobacillus thermoglucosidasius]|uniref:Uncharacterized protein n=1 Tax=Parageobacillus thermoglucosidasius TaxID=1426 RepID=A0AB38R6B4_PARTM|nr:hypothetical protein [Parageobacillus thermoglucosidasius]UOE78395.1 hypothetical protein IMI45_20065 [Parageobacillus thermoglucosidasius]